MKLHPNLKLWYQLESSPLDSTGNSVGSEIGTITYVSTAMGRGISQAVNASNGIKIANTNQILDSIFCGANKSYTIFARIKTTDNTKTNVVIGRYSSADNSRGFAIQFSGGKIAIILADNTDNAIVGYIGTTTLDNNTEYTIAVRVFNSYTLDNIFINGVSESVTNFYTNGVTFSAQIADSMLTACIGSLIAKNNTIYTSATFVGVISEIQVYNTYLYEIEIRRLHYGLSINTNR